MTYAIFTNAFAVVELAHDPLQFLLQVQPPGALLGRSNWQGENPFLKDSPHRGARTARLNDLQILLLWAYTVG